MRNKVLIGNWKMNKTISETSGFINGVDKNVVAARKSNLIVGIAPSFLSLETAAKSCENLIVVAQNCHYENSGAFTGEVSIPMLKDINVKYCLVGHSERRQYNGETNLTCNKKIISLFASGLTPVYCVGETLAQYEMGETFDVVKKQVVEGLAKVNASDVEKMIIAYEPIWSIGTGKNADSSIAQNVCKLIRDAVESLYSKEVAAKVIIQYGGSVKPENIVEYLSKPDIDGALVGGASLKIDSYLKMVNNLLQ
jgi:triosephosphate isomerase